MCEGGSFVFICFYKNVFWVVVVWFVEKASACAKQVKKNVDQVGACAREMRMLARALARAHTHTHKHTTHAHTHDK